MTGAPAPKTRRTVALPHAGGRILTWLLCGALAILAAEQAQAEAPVAASTAQSSETAAPPGAFATIESAIYHARLEGDDLVAGRFEMFVARRGSGVAALSLSEARLALSELRWGEEPAVWGVAGDDRTLLLCDRDEAELSGRWSLHGRRFSDMIVFDAVFPSALNTLVQLDAPESFRVTATQGLLREESSGAPPGHRRWTLDLGRDSAPTLRIAAEPRAARSPLLRYEMDTTHLARRDGLFLQSDITIERPPPQLSSLTILVPPGIDVQALQTSSGLALPYQRIADDPTRIVAPLRNLSLDSRLTLRIRGFQPVDWGGLQRLPRFRLDQAQELRRVLTVRVEPPLQMRAAESQGMVQTELSSDESAGDVWRYEARDPEAFVEVEVALPRAEIVSEMACLLDDRSGSPWIAALISLRSESGSRFDAAIQLPADWELVSVAGGDADSRIASWRLDDRRLHLVWQNPITRSATRQVRLFGMCSTLARERPGLLPLPIVLDAVESKIAFQALLPADETLEILEGESWRVTDQRTVNPLLLPLREVSARLPDAAQLSATSLLSSGRVDDLPVIQISSSHRETPATAHSGLPTAIPREVPSTASGRATLTLLTQAGQSLAQERVHHAVLRFDPPIPAAELDLELPEECPLSAVAIDERIITVLREGRRVQFPAEINVVTRLRLTYQSTGTSSWRHSVNDVPLPRVRPPIEEFAWTLDLPANQRVSQLLLPGILTIAPAPAGGANKLFGPLQREAGEGVFNPFSLADWATLWRTPRPGGRLQETERRLYSLHSPQVGEIARFVTWSASQSRNDAWLALLGSLLVGVLSRMAGWNGLRRWALPWLSLLVVLLAAAPDVWSERIGGLFLGSLLSLLIPRRLVQRRDLLEWRSAAAPSSGPALGAALLGALALTGLGGLPAGAADRAGERERGGLIESATYELRSLTSVAEIRARFQVLLPPGSQDAIVRFPFQNVIFGSGAECLVDGRPFPLIPAVSGDAMLVAIPPALAPTGESSAVDWRTRSVEMDFQIRSPEIESGPLLTGWDAIVPRVIDSQLIIPAGLPVPELERRGESQLGEEGETRLHLGGLGRLSSTGGAGERSVLPAEAAATTLLDVSPLRIRAQSRIYSPREPFPAVLPLRFPEGAIVTSVTGTGLLDWFEVAVPDGMGIIVRFRSDVDATSLNITCDLPPAPFQDGLVTIPELPLCGGPENPLPHSLGVIVPPATAVHLVSANVSQLSAEGWQASADVGRVHPALAFTLKTPQPVTLQLTRLAAERTASVSESLIVRKDALHWTAVIRSSVTTVPAFRHQFRVDPQLRIDAVTAGQDGNEGSLRFTREGDVISLFVPGGQTNERVFTLSGTVPMMTETWTSIPQLVALNATQTNGELLIRDETHWNVELETAAGTRLTTQATSAEPRSSDDARQLALPKGSASRPARLRVTPPRTAVRADGAVHLRAPADGDWELVSQFQFTASDVPLRRVVFRIPPDYGPVRVRPTHLRSALVAEESGGALTVRLPPNRKADVATITLTARLPAALRQQLQSASQGEVESVPVPLIEVVSAQLDSLLLLLDRPSGLIAAAAPRGPEDEEELPGWLPAEWRRGLRDRELSTFRIDGARVALAAAASDLGNGQPRLILEETVLWPLEDGSLRGASTLWIDPRTAPRLTLSPQAGVTLERVLAGGHALGSGELSVGQIPLPARRGDLLAVEAHWSAASATAFPFPQLRFDDAVAETRILSFVHDDGHRVERGNAAPASAVEVWLLRGRLLLEASADSSALSPVVHREIERCLEQAQTLAPAADSQAAQDLEDLAVRWRQLQQRLPTGLAAGGSGATIAEQPDSLLPRMLASRHEADHALLRLDEAEWTGRVSLRRTPAGSGRLAVALVGFLAAVLLVVRFQTPLQHARDLLADHPPWTAGLLGIGWWLWLSPSVAGLAILLLALGAAVWNWTRSRRSRVDA